MRKDWKIKKLGDVCISIKDGSHNPPKGMESGCYIMLSSQNIQDGYIDFNNSKFISEDDFYKERKRVQIKKGDLLLTIVGTIGRTCVFDGSVNNVVFQRSVAILSPKTNVDSFFLRYFIKSQRSLLEKEAKGVAQKGIYLKQLSEFNVQVPPLQTQQQIVEELDCLSSIIEKQKKQLEELDNLAQAIFYDMFGDPIENEKRWDVKKLDNICNITSSKRIYSHEYVETGIPFYRGKEITEKCKSLNLSVELFISVEKYEELKKNFGAPQIGDLLLTAVGTIGNIWIVDTETPFYFKDGNILWLKNIVNIIPVFLKFLLELQISELKNKLANGCAYNALTIMNLKILNIIMPPLTLQQQFASKIEAIEKQKELIKKSIKETEDLFNSRMDYYFN